MSRSNMLTETNVGFGSELLVLSSVVMDKYDQDSVERTKNLGSIHVHASIFGPISTDEIQMIAKNKSLLILLLGWYDS